jgi:hypothetical protein
MIFKGCGQKARANINTLTRDENAQRGNDEQKMCSKESTFENSMSIPLNPSIRLCPMHGQGLLKPFIYSVF